MPTVSSKRGPSEWELEGKGGMELNAPDWWKGNKIWGAKTPVGKMFDVRSDGNQTGGEFPQSSAVVDMGSTLMGHVP